jgi:hypothetical protein
MLHVVGIDIGRNNLALASVYVRAPHLCMATTVAQLNEDWRVVRVQNLQLGGGPHEPLTHTLPKLHHELNKRSWDHRIRSADTVIIEQQTGQLAPHNFALQTALHMFCLDRLKPEQVVIASNLRKLSRMASYGFIQPRERGTKSTRRNKNDVVDWVKAEVKAGRLPVDWAERGCINQDESPPRKLDDVADALTHVLAVWWELRETPALRRALSLRRPARPYHLSVPLAVLGVEGCASSATSTAADARADPGGSQNSAAHAASLLLPIDGVPVAAMESCQQPPGWTAQGAHASCALRVSGPTAACPSTSAWAQARQ